MPNASSPDRFSQVVNGVLAACAVAVTILAVAHELRVTRGNSGDEAPRKVANWTALATSGRRIGPEGATVQIVEFGDFECPACGYFARSVLSTVMAKYPGRVALVFHHWPLSYHRFAYPAARAVECASVQGRFPAMYDLVYRHQDSLGLKSFQSFAADAQVPDTAAFNRCDSVASPVPAIEVDMQVATQLKARATPTIIINGMLYSTPPDSAQVLAIVAAAVRSAQ